MTTLSLSTFRPASLAAPVLDRVAALAGGVAARFRRSLDIRVDDHRARIARTGLAGMI